MTRVPQQPTSPSPSRAASRERGYTLTEILVVIGLIVLLIAVAVPVLSVLSGNRSTEAAENQVAAMVGQARAQAIALQKNIGVAFFVDPASQRYTMALVGQQPGEAWIERLPDYDFVPLQTGTGLQLINDDRMAKPNVNAAGRDRYVRFGVVMFDGRGEAIASQYRIQVDSALAQAIDVRRILADAGAGNAATYPPMTQVAYSQLGLVLYDNEAFARNNFSAKEGMSTGDEAKECEWLDANAAPLVINRYNGTLIRGE
jgi:prepilin-type N-terminal cleavage/methylation domain-containing protein